MLPKMRNQFRGQNDELHFAAATGISGVRSLYYLY